MIQKHLNQKQRPVPNRFCPVPRYLGVTKNGAATLGGVGGPNFP